MTWEASTVFRTGGKRDSGGGNRYIWKGRAASSRAARMRAGPWVGDAMGRSIVYCDKCGQLLKEEDFRQGKASVADNRNFCGTCRPPSNENVLPPAVKKASSTRIAMQPSKESVSSSRILKQ